MHPETTYGSMYTHIYIYIYVDCTLNLAGTATLATSMGTLARSKAGGWVRLGLGFARTQIADHSKYYMRHMLPHQVLHEAYVASSAS